MIQHTFPPRLRDRLRGGGILPLLLLLGPVLGIGAVVVFHQASERAERHRAEETAKAWLEANKGEAERLARPLEKPARPEGEALSDDDARRAKAAARARQASLNRAYRESHQSVVSDDDSGKSEAWSAVRAAVSERLKNPSSADFPMYDPAYLQNLGNGTFRVSAYVDATNSFGAEVRTHFTCTVENGMVLGLSIR